MIVVSDTSPLIALATIGKLDVLRQLYGEVLVPRAVHDEAAFVRPDAPGAAEVRSVPWIQVRAVNDQLLVAALSLHLDVGEAEAIALAVESDADLLLMDERRGRLAAMRLGRRVVGVLGAGRSKAAPSDHACAPTPGHARQRCRFSDQPRATRAGVGSRRRIAAIDSISLAAGSPLQN